MSHTSHDLAADFPADAARIARMKAENPHFSKLVDDYAKINLAVNRAESRLDAVSSEHESDLRRQRAAIKDEIHRALIKSA